MDGNFCGDYDFSHHESTEPLATWGGSPKDPRPTWGGDDTGIIAMKREVQADGSHVRMGFRPEYDYPIPLGKYISPHLGGFLSASSRNGCIAYPGSYEGDVRAGGDIEHLRDQMDIDKAKSLGQDQMWFMTSNCPHETIELSAGVRRTLVRITLPYDYDNRVMFKE